MRNHRWEAFNPTGPLCELCGVAKDTQYADMECTGRADPRDVEIDTLKARVAELEAVTRDMRERLDDMLEPGERGEGGSDG